jgi:hypothetical protein
MQLMWMILLAPVMVAQQGIAFSQLPEYFATGTAILMGKSIETATLFEAGVPAIYIAWNIAFNITGLLALRAIGAATMTLASTAAIPMAIWAFTLTWPLLGAAPPLGPDFVLGACTIVAGMLLYNSPLLVHAFWDQRRGPA